MNRAGLEVSELCLGTMYFGVKTTEKEAFDFIDIYSEAGGNFLDTANKYATWIPGFPEPVGERLIGRYLESRRARSDFIIATKLGFAYGDIPAGLTRRLIIQETEKSLKRLGVDTIDLLYAHADDFDTPQEETLRAFDDLIHQGKVRAIGASNFYAWRIAAAEVEAVRNGLHQYACVQTRLSFLWPERTAAFGRQLPATEELIAYSRRSGVTLLCYSPLLGGVFGNREKGTPDGYATIENTRIIERVREIGTELGASGNGVVLAWMIANGFIPLITGSSEAQIRENTCSAELKLPAEILAELNGFFFPPPR